MYSWGEGSSGQLGLGHWGSSSVPVEVESLRDRGVRRLACGDKHSMALLGEWGMVLKVD